MRPGATPRPLPAPAAVGAVPTWREPRLVKGHLLWLEGRPQEQGRTTLLMRPAGERHALPRELTPPPWNLRSRLHSGCRIGNGHPSPDKSQTGPLGAGRGLGGGGRRGKRLLFPNELTASPQGRFCRQKYPVLRQFCAHLAVRVLAAMQICVWGAGSAASTFTM